MMKCSLCPLGPFLLAWSHLEDKVTQKQESQRFHDNAGNKMREFILGQDVLVENLRSSALNR